MDDAYAIRLAKTEFRDAYNKGDVSRVSAVFAGAYSDMSSGLASFYGTEAQAVLKYRLKKLFARYRAELAVTIVSIRVQGQLAFDWGWHKLTLTPKKGGMSITTRTRYLESGRRTPTAGGRPRFSSITWMFRRRCHRNRSWQRWEAGAVGVRRSVHGRRSKIGQAA